MKIERMIERVERSVEYIKSHSTEVAAYIKNTCMETGANPQQVALQVAEPNIQMSQLNNWKKYGSKLFILEDSLVTAFQHTDIPMHIVLSDVHVPFDCFAIESSGEPFFYVDGTPCDVVLYFRSNTVPGGVIDVAKNGDMSVGEKATAFLIGLCHGEDVLGNCHIAIEDGLSLEDHRMNYAEMADEDRQNLVNVFVNTVLYINDTTREASTAEPRSHKIKVNGKRTRSSYIYLHAPKSLSIPTGEGSKIDCRFMVRGHYRNQACGEAMKERKLIWILPYWKGPSLVEVVSKPYKVGVYE
jgi:hypothetical protein